jgi:uncharacterized membrane protein
VFERRSQFVGGVLVIVILVLVIVVMYFCFLCERFHSGRSDEMFENVWSNNSSETHY